MIFLPLLLANEAFWWVYRRNKRSQFFSLARERARILNRPLVVVGAPDRGPTRGYDCGDITVDIGNSSCQNFLQADVTKSLPFPDNSVVVFLSCVLEYVKSNADFAWRELQRISGGEMYAVGVEPWTITAHLYPGARRTLLSEQRSFQPNSRLNYNLNQIRLSKLLCLNL